MNATLQKSLKLPPMDQVGFVYRDIEVAIKRYEPMFGPFKRMNPGPFEYVYRGKAEVSELKLAFGNSGDIEIELIEWVSGGTPHKEFIDAGREGMQHLRFIVDDLQTKIDEAAAFAYLPIWRGKFAENLEVAYLEREGDPLVVEFFENAGIDKFQQENSITAE